MAKDPLDLFHPAVSRWFRESFSEPTPAQAGGWPRIAAGENTLILAPTGSGKTLAAFLYAIHELVSRPTEEGEPTGVHALYVSPVKALASDIERNLNPLLDGVRACAARMGTDLPEVRVAVRTGDTTPTERRQMVRRPPHLLITTPESLHLLLTSPRAREMLRTVRHVIVDEIHSLIPEKRGTFLALLLERLEVLTGASPIRVGLSATQRPLDRVAAFLGGYTADGAPRSVRIVDAGMRKDLDLRVESPVEDMKVLPNLEGVGPTIWPGIHERLLDWVEEHASTLIFANNRRLVERIAAEMNRLAGHDLVRAHHGSLSKVQRHEIERELKAGKLPALVATSSLELGIDVGAIDLVCQVEAPTSVASALQRIGRAGHLYRRTSKGRLVPKTRDDLLRLAGIARAASRGEISAVRPPENALDVLAQQIVAMVAVEDWSVDALYAAIRRAYPYRALPRSAFLAVLDLVSGRYRSPAVAALRPRVAWDRERDVVQALPGSRQAVVLNGGTIPDSGQYPMVLEDGKTRLGELDEEFVFERRLGQTILLGTSRWRILEIGADRVIVGPSEESTAVMPFWKGEGLGQDAEFGRHLGEFLRACRKRVSSERFESWLAGECALDASAARNLATYLRDQLDRGGDLPDDRTILVDGFRDERGDPRAAVLTPFGRAFHQALLLAVQGVFRARGAEPPPAVFSNVGILFRAVGTSFDGIVSALRELRAENVEERIKGELPHTPFFALRFRRNAARALLLPRARPGRRTPLWLQRLRAGDLLAYASAHREFPIIVETYREILEDLLPLDELRRLLSEVENGGARIAVRRGASPSPFVSPLVLEFTAGFFYDEDRPAPEARGDRSARDQMLALLRTRSDALLLDVDAVAAIDERLQGRSEFGKARDGVELVDLLRRVGDLTEEELRTRAEGPALGNLPDLIADGRIVRVLVADAGTPERLVAPEDRAAYDRWEAADVRRVVSRFVSNRAAVSRAEVASRYPGAGSVIDELVVAGDLVEVTLSNGETRLANSEVVSGIRRLTLARRRRRVCRVGTEAFSASILQRHRLGAPRVGEDAVREALVQLAGWPMPAGVWEEVLAARVEGFQFDALDRLVREGEVTWRGYREPAGGAIAFAAADQGWMLGRPDEPARGSPLERKVLDHLATHGASYLHQIAGAIDVRPSEAAEAIWELIWGGRVTNDSLAPAWGGRPDPRTWQGRRSSPWGGGRWSLRAEGDGGRSEDEIRGRLRVLLERYGLLSRELVERERLAPRWREAYPVLSRMEWCGDVDRGLFVEGLSGLQFALPSSEAALKVDDADGLTLLNALDPANVWGDVVPIVDLFGARYALRHHSGNYLAIRGGRPVLAIETTAERLIPLAEMDVGERRDVLALLPALVRKTRRRTAIRVRGWGEGPIAETPVAEELERLGFMREDQLMILYRGFGGEE